VERGRAEMENEMMTEPRACRQQINGGVESEVRNLEVSEDSSSAI
jgi:hypothetical protein